MPLSHPTLFTIHAAFTEQLSAVGLHAAGTSCKRGHPQFIEKVRMVEVHSVKQSQGQVGPGLLSSVVSGARGVQAPRATMSGLRV